MLFATFKSYAQQYPLDAKRDNVWVFGYDDDYPWGLSVVDFSNGAPVSTYDTVPFWIWFTNAAVCDTSGQLLFYTNGNQVANREHEVTPNGAGLGCCYFWYSQDVTDGSSVPQGALILPHPGQPDIYAAIVSPLEYYPLPITTALPVVQYNLFDATLDNGLGDITLKNQSILTDTLSNNGHAACRHANGRDWWILEREWNKPNFYKILFDPAGFHIADTQWVNVSMPDLFGQYFFTPDGNKFVATGLTSDNGTEAHVYVFDFDRCTGQLSNSEHVQFTSPAGASSMGGAPSPDSRFVYTSFYNRVYQFDLEAPDLAVSMVEVAVYDGFVDTLWSTTIPTTFIWMQPAPDNKIYITAGNTRYLHVIENPNGNEMLCNVSQHSFELSALNRYSIPYFPNFRLGPIDGSSCDTLGIDVIGSVFDSRINNELLRIYPNPGSDQFACTYNPSSHKAVIEVFDAVGRLWLSVPAKENSTRVSTKALPAGFYTVKLVDGGKPLAVRRWVKTQ
ncbi:MAG TPA: T9SS type A sorting domain-containing protein [Chitinophagales bacterium]|nr:T9SS type A sorting domain-containing protein [Chitinophagales bacterium]